MLTPSPSMDMAEPRYTWLRLRRRELRPKMKARPWVCPPDPNLRLSVRLLRLVDSSFLFYLLDATIWLFSTLYFNKIGIYFFIWLHPYPFLLALLLLAPSLWSLPLFWSVKPRTLNPIKYPIKIKSSIQRYCWLILLCGTSDSSHDSSVIRSSSIQLPASSFTSLFSFPWGAFSRPFQPLPTFRI